MPAGAEIHPTGAKRSLGEIRGHQPVQVHQPHEQNKDGDDGEQLEIALQIAREQQREGQGEVAEHQREADELPAAA